MYVRKVGGHIWEFYVDDNGKFRWRRKAKNGRVIGASTQGYAEGTSVFANAYLNGLPEADRDCVVGLRELKAMLGEFNSKAGAK